MPAELRRDVRLLTTMLGDAIAESGGTDLLDAGGGAPPRRRSRCGARPTTARRRRGRRARGIARRRARRRRDPGVHLLLPAREPGGGAPALRVLRASRPARASRSRARSRRSGRATPSAFADLRITPGAHRPPHRGQASGGGRAPVADRRPARAPRRRPASEPPEEQEIHAAPARGDRRAVATDPIRHHRPEPLDEVRATLALFDQTIFTTLPPIYREVDRALDPEGCGARRARVRAVPAMGHLGRRRPRRQPVGHRRGHAGGDRRSQTDHVLRGLEAPTRRIARTLSVTRARRAAEPRAAPGARCGTHARCPGRPELGRKLPDAPHRRKLGLAAHRLAATRTRIRGRLRRRRPSSSPTSTCCNAPSTPAARRGWRGASCSTCAGRRRRSGSTWRRWRCASMRGARRRAARAGTEAAASARARPPGASEGGHAARPTTAETREVLATFRAIGDIQDAPRAGGVRAGHRELHASRPPTSPACWRSRASPRRTRPADVMPVPAARVAARARDRDRDPGRVARAARHEAAPAPAAARARGDGRLLRFREGSRACSPPTSSCTGAARRWQRGRASTDVRLTIFHGRGGALGPRRRPRQPGDPRGSRRARSTAGSR